MLSGHWLLLSMSKLTGILRNKAMWGIKWATKACARSRISRLHWRSILKSRWEIFTNWISLCCCVESGTPFAGDYILALAWIKEYEGCLLEQMRWVPLRLWGSLDRTTWRAGRIWEDCSGLVKDAVSIDEIKQFIATEWETYSEVGIMCLAICWGQWNFRRCGCWTSKRKTWP
jgi:hypothetical protein